MYLLIGGPGVPILQLYLLPSTGLQVVTKYFGTTSWTFPAVRWGESAGEKLIRIQIKELSIAIFQGEKKKEEKKNLESCTQHLPNLKKFNMPPRSANKDPNKPKGRMSAYAFFLKEKRERYREKAVEVEFTAFSKECADEWKQYTPENKARYNGLAEKDKLRFQREMERYEPGPGYDRKGKKESGGKKKRKKKEKDPNMPKRAM